MTATLITGSFRGTFEAWLQRPAPGVHLAAPFLTFRIAQWLSTLPACRRGDRRLLVAWASDALDHGYLSANGVDHLRLAGFEVKDLPTLHAKLLVVGSSRAYVGSGNLTSFGIDGINSELGLLLSGALAKDVKAQFEAWWSQAHNLTETDLAAAKQREARRAVELRGVDHESQPGWQPRQVPHFRIDVGPPDPKPAVAANPPVVVSYWRRDTMAANLHLAGKRVAGATSQSRMAARFMPGTRVFNVAWAPFGGLLLLNAWTISAVRRREDGWRLHGEDGTPIRFDRAVIGAEYRRYVRLRNQRQAPDHYMAFSPFAADSAATREDRRRVTGSRTNSSVQWSSSIRVVQTSLLARRDQRARRRGVTALVGKRGQSPMHSCDGSWLAGRIRSSATSAPVSCCSCWDRLRLVYASDR